MTKKQTNEMDNGKLLWALEKRGGELKLFMAVCRKQRTERDQREEKVSLNSNDSII